MTESDPPLSLAVGEVGAGLAFCMCNPPFYRESEAKAGPALARIDGRRPRRPPPHSLTIARPHEVCAEGGEVAFVTRIIKDSAVLQRKIKSAFALAHPAYRDLRRPGFTRPSWGRKAASPSC